MILAIDPGNIESGYVLTNNDLTIVKSGKINNQELLEDIEFDRFESLNPIESIEHIAIEMVACYGMAVGKSIFDTCVFIGKLSYLLEDLKGYPVTFIYRKDEKMNLCNSMKANDSNITQALIDRFAPNTPNKGKGTKKEPGWFYGFKKDIWQAYAVAVTYYDMYIEGNKYE